MLYLLFGMENDDSIMAFLFIISFFILLFSVIIALLRDSINSFNVTFLNLGKGVLGINSGISSPISILSKIRSFFSSFPNRISSMLFTYLLSRVSDLILKRNAAAS